MAEQVYLDRIEKLRVEMRKANIDVYLLFMNDDHGSEYIADYFKQIAYYTAFTGSNAMVLVTMEKVLLWTDGRYFLQAEMELKKSDAMLMKMGQENVPTMLQYVVSLGYQIGDKKENKCFTIGFDGSLVSYAYIAALQKEWKRNQKTDTKGKIMQEVILQLFCEQDVSGQLWDMDEVEKRPSLMQKPIWMLDVKSHGMETIKKLEKVRKEMEEKGQDVLILSALDEIAWLTNLRGDDISYNPVFYAYMMLQKDSCVLYVKDIANEISTCFKQQGIKVKAYESFYEDVKGIIEKNIWLDDGSSNYKMVKLISKSCQLKLAKTPVYYHKAVKNVTEIENEKTAHILDGIAVTRFIYWLKTRVCTGIEEASEISIAQKLEEFRKQQRGYMQQSFAPIMAYGEHGAIVHYEADAESNISLEQKSFLLSDTGGHYNCGSTDITRTIAMGPLTDAQRMHYTAVLKGNLRLMHTTFKQGLKGSHLDFVARQPLYELGLDFNHGTGHGVGYILNVHEGPNAFRLKEDNDNVFLPGMITSDEPGVYLANQYGIRLENMILCVEKSRSEYGIFLGFEPLTLVPFDKDAIDTEQMTSEDKRFLNAYHKKVWELISPHLSKEEKEWLMSQTSPIE